MLALYRLLKDVNREQAGSDGHLGRCDGSGNFFLNARHWIAALSSFMHGGGFLGVFTTPQLEAVAMRFLRLHRHGNVVNGLFWGLWLVSFGLLVIKWGFCRASWDFGDWSTASRTSSSPRSPSLRRHTTSARS